MFVVIPRTNIDHDNINKNLINLIDNVSGLYETFRTARDVNPWQGARSGVHTAPNWNLVHECDGK